MKSSNKITKKYVSSQIAENEKVFSKDDFCNKTGLSLYINELMREKGLESASEIYTRAGISKQTWSHIYSGQYCPSPENARKLTIGLKCTLSEAEKLLSYCGMSFVPGNDNDECFKYCIENQIFRIVDVLICMKDKGSFQIAA